jgi:stage II sporulation protein M
VVASVVVFFATAFAGYAVVDAIPLDQLSAFVPDESVLPELSVVGIALNNLRVLALLAAGVVTFGVLGLVVLSINGLVVGAVVALTVERLSWVVVLGALAPHGILELPAFWIGAAIGFRFAYRVGRWALGYDETPLSRVEAFELVVWFTALALTIAIAAWIEVVVTPEVMRMLGGPTL